MDSESRAKITLQNNIVTVLIDKKGEGYWEKCLEANLAESDTQPKVGHFIGTIA